MSRHNVFNEEWEMYFMYICIYIYIVYSKVIRHPKHYA